MSKEEEFEDLIRRCVDRYDGIPPEVREKVLQKNAQRLRQQQDRDGKWADNR